MIFVREHLLLNDVYGDRTCARTYHFKPRVVKTQNPIVISLAPGSTIELYLLNTEQKQFSLCSDHTKL